jgi:hypothetical protein
MKMKEWLKQQFPVLITRIDGGLRIPGVLQSTLQVDVRLTKYHVLEGIYTCIHFNTHTYALALRKTKVSLPECGLFHAHEGH